MVGSTNKRENGGSGVVVDNVIRIVMKAPIDWNDRAGVKSQCFASGDRDE